MAEPKDITEVWLPVVDWEGYYEVSNYGRIKALPRKRKQWSSRWTGGGIRAPGLSMGYEGPTH